MVAARRPRTSTFRQPTMLSDKAHLYSSLRYSLPNLSLAITLSDGFV
uniref:Uncharacterized protein n=1 Tax=Mesocestoides corti TaxID=53468 RepID=A0A5K3EU76_MESCO